MQKYQRTVHEFYKKIINTQKTIISELSKNGLNATFAEHY